MIDPFHLAIPVKDLATTRKFYGEILRLKEGRSCEDWIDWDFFGHQLSTHVKPQELEQYLVASNKVDGKNVPVRHFGIVLEWQKWHELANCLRLEAAAKKIEFVIEPYIRFKDAIGEQATMFLLDYSGNALEFKSFKDKSQLFRGYDVSH